MPKLSFTPNRDGTAAGKGERERQRRVSGGLRGEALSPAGSHQRYQSLQTASKSLGTTDVGVMSSNGHEGRTPFRAWDELVSTVALRGPSVLNYSHALL